MIKFISYSRRLMAASVAVVSLLGISPAHGEVNKHFTDIPEKLTHATAQMRENLKNNPDAHVDSIEARILTDMSIDGPVGKLSDLKGASKKKLSAEQVFEKCHRSSLVFGKMEHVPYIKADSAYSNASAVVLTPDGVCATNFHVVADLVLRGAMNHKVDTDRGRFVMDYDGNCYPVTDVLTIDPLNDFAIIKVDTKGTKLTAPTIGDDLPQGATVYCLSHPSGAYYHFTKGIVSNNTRKTDPRKGSTKYITEITADYGVGASGGPIFDECGNLVAIVSSTFSLYGNPQQYRNFQMSYKQTVPVFLIKERFTK